MFKKFDMGFSVVIFIVFIIAAIYLIISGIVDLFVEKKVDLGNTNLKFAEEFVNIYKEDEEYIKKSNYLVRDYNTYYTIKNATDNLILNISEDKYSDIYTILSQELKDKYTKEDFITEFKKFVKENITEQELENISDINFLEKVYAIERNSYLCELKFETNAKTIGLIFDEINSQYKIFYIEF